MKTFAAVASVVACCTAVVHRRRPHLHQAESRGAAEAAVSERRGVLAARGRAAAFHGLRGRSEDEPVGAAARLAFWTTDLVPQEHGYHGPIHILVGMDMTGMLTGVVVTYNSEPYGYFSVEPPKFAAQFKGKNIRDPFRVGGDVDAVSRASISIASAARAIRDSARMVAKQLLPPRR